MHQEFMLHALSQAQLGRGQCAPNPSVGAVAVQNGAIVASAWHRGAGTPHAEVMLLAQIVTGPPALTTLYVTLEPCNHWGRTPPCVAAIIAHGGIQRVVYAYTDPNPLVSAHHSPHILQEHGIEVVHYAMPEIDDFYQSYAYWLRTQKPWVTVKIAQSLDGKIAGNAGARVGISNADCWAFTHQQRRATDIILTTARTIIQDNPELNARDGAIQAKHLAILDSNLGVKADAKALQLAQNVHIFYDRQHKRFVRHPGCTYFPTPTYQKRLDLETILGHLGALGYHDVWVEAGAQLFRALHRSKMVNRTYLYLAPTVIGHAGLALYQEDILSCPHAVAWQVMQDNVILTLDWSC